MAASKMEILRGEILLSSVDDILNMLNMLAAAREEGAEQMKADIRKAGQITEYDADGYAILFAVHASVLAPKEPTDDEKINRLAEIVAEMSATEPPYEIITRAGSYPPVLSPTKVSEK